jgi:hypothetical protein
MASTLAETARRYRAFFAVLVAFSMVASLFGAAVLTARAAQAQPVFLEPAHAAGEDPFVPSLLDPGPAAAQAIVPETAGTGDQGTCDPATLTAYLNGHPDAAAAWTAALNADPTLKWSGGNQVTIEQISAYIGELTPAVLGGDMQVTNHRFTDGKLGTVQSVLQQGTAVLVDADGTPRVRCACGNPLAPAADSAQGDGGTDYVGEPWNGFSYDDSDANTDTHAWDDNDDHWDHPVADCRRGEYRDDDGNCLQPCPHGTWRGDDGRCRAPIDRCDVKDRDKPDWCKPRPDCSPPSDPKAQVATDTDRHVPPCHPQCPDGTSSDKYGDKHCTPPPSHPKPCTDGKACPGDPTSPKDPVVCPLVDAVASTVNKVVAPGTDQGKPCQEAEKSKPAAEGTPDQPNGPPPADDKKAPENPPQVTDKGQNPPAVPSVPAVVDKVLSPVVGDQPPTPPKTDPPAANPDPATGAKPAEEPKAADPAPAAEGKADPPLPAVVKQLPLPPLPIVGSAPESKPAPAPEPAPPAVAPAPKKAAPEPSPAAPKKAAPDPSPAAQPAPKVALPAPVANLLPKKETAAPAPRPAPAPKPAPKPSPKAVPALPPPASGTTCPNGTAMPANGCAVPATGVPAGWVQRGTRMVPA